MENKNDKKESNRLYYLNNKADITEKLYRKEECDCCGRKVNHQNMTKHKLTKYCMKRIQQKTDNEILEKVKNNEWLKNAIQKLVN